MKTKEELNALKAEVEALNAKLAELTGEELRQIGGGLIPCYPWKTNSFTPETICPELRDEPDPIQD